MLVFTLDSEMLLTLSWKVFISFFFQRTSNQVSTQCCGPSHGNDWVNLLALSQRWHTSSPLDPRGSRSFVFNRHRWKQQEHFVKYLWLHLPLQQMQETQVGFPRKGSGNPLQYSCLGNPMERGPWLATVHGVSKNQTWLTTTHKHTHIYFQTYDFSIPHSNCFSSIWETILSY